MLKVVREEEIEVNSSPWIPKAKIWKFSPEQDIAGWSAICCLKSPETAVLYDQELRHERRTSSYDLCWHETCNNDNVIHRFVHQIRARRYSPMTHLTLIILEAGTDSRLTNEKTETDSAWPSSSRILTSASISFPSSTWNKWRNFPLLFASNLKRPISVMMLPYRWFELRCCECRICELRSWLRSKYTCRRWTAWRLRFSSAQSGTN